MIKVNGEAINIAKFPDGTYNLLNTDIHYILSKSRSKVISISWIYDGEEEMSLIYYIANYIKELHNHYKIDLLIPYLPNARMDRVGGEYEIFTLKYFCKFINSLKCNLVTSYDVHSNVGRALINKFTDVFPMLNISRAIDDSKPTLLYYPDEGAMKRYSNRLINSGIPYIYGMKVREWSTGEIKGIEICGNKDLIKDSNILIIDDICSMGGTFYFSANKLKEFNPNKIDLYITHCEDFIYKGRLLNTDLISTIYTTDSILHDTSNSKIKLVYKFRDE